MPTFKEMIQELDDKRKGHFANLAAIPEEDRTSADRKQLEFSPLTSNIMFLVPHGEPFFDKVYPVLQQRGKHKTTPTIHFGIGGTRNLSIIGATKADAAVLADLNLEQQAIMNTIDDVATQLIKEKGIGNFGPEEFVRTFAQHQIQEVLATAEQGHGLHIRTDLAEELIVPESWLFKDQTDGGFEHVMQLYKDHKIGTIALNLTDEGGFKSLAATLEDTKRKVPGLKDAEIDTVFLSNMMGHLAKPQSYFSKRGVPDTTPQGSVEIAWNNIKALAPHNDPYVIFADQVIERIPESINIFLGNTRVTSPSSEAVTSKINISDPDAVVHFSPPGEHHCDWNISNQITMGGALSVVRTVMKQAHDKGSHLRQSEVSSTNTPGAAASSKIIATQNKPDVSERK